MSKILAIDLGKFRSVTCCLDTDTHETEFWTMSTDRPYLLAVLKLTHTRLHSRHLTHTRLHSGPIDEAGRCAAGTHTFDDARVESRKSL